MADSFPARKYLVGPGNDVQFLWQQDSLGAWWNCIHLFGNSLSIGPCADVDGEFGATLYLKLYAINDYVYFGFLI